MKVDMPLKRRKQAKPNHFLNFVVFIRSERHFLINRIINWTKVLIRILYSIWNRNIDIIMDRRFNETVTGPGFF